jgi:cytochrome c-type biogenesis protein CcmH/NrfG
MGWVALALIVAGAAGALVLLRVDRLLWSMIGAALMLGAAGYAWQGSPTMPAHPARSGTLAVADDPSLIDLRERMLGRFTADSAYLTASDAMARAGDRRSAVRAILGGLNRYPNSVMLWTALGTALAAHDGSTPSPPALFAFRQASRIAPWHPAPHFFLGLTRVRANDYASARASWRRALARSPAGASYRRDIAIRLRLLEAVLAEQDASGR